MEHISRALLPETKRQKCLIMPRLKRLALNFLHCIERRSEMMVFGTSGSCESFPSLTWALWHHTLSQQSQTWASRWAVILNRTTQSEPVIRTCWTICKGENHPLTAAVILYYSLAGLLQCINFGHCWSSLTSPYTSPSCFNCTPLLFRSAAPRGKKIYVKSQRGQSLLNCCF